MININIKESKRCVGEYSLYISFDYDTKIIDVIRSYPNRYWNPDDKNWEIPFNKLSEFINALPEYDYDITGKYVALEQPKTDIPEGFTFKTEPFKHQIEGFTFGLKYNRWLLGDEMGLGKTKQVIDIAVAKKLHYGFKHCLIVCGVNGLKWNWTNEVATHSNEQAWILGQRTKGNKTVIGSNKDKLSDLVDISEGKLSDKYFIITNIETLRNKDIVAELDLLCRDKTIGMIACDEAHKAIKNPSAQQAKGLLKLSAKTMIAMTGTPLMNTPLDLYGILRWLGYEKHSFYTFRNHFCVMGGFGGYEVIAYQNLDELQNQLNSIMLRRRKDDVLDLPDKVYIDEYVDMSEKQAQIYREVSAAIKMNIDKIKEANNPLAELIRMRQATGYTGILSSNVAESAKIDRLVELMEECTLNGQKAVIFSNWTQITDIVYDRLNSFGYKVAQITGETPDNQRQYLIDKFQNTDEIQIMLGTTGAMGTGVTLTAATVECFLDEPWNRANKEQAEDRCHRIGQKQNLTIYTLMCRNTIDERIHNIVYKKGAMADALIDGIEKTDKRQLVDYLLS